MANVSKRHNICVGKPYVTGQGEQKKQWITIGTAVTFDDGSIVGNFNALPTGSWWDGSFSLFAQEPRTQQASQGGYSQAQQGGGYNQGSYPQQGYGQGYQSTPAPQQQQPYPQPSQSVPPVRDEPPF